MTRTGALGAAITLGFLLACTGSPTPPPPPPTPPPAPVATTPPPPPAPVVEVCCEVARGETDITWSRASAEQCRADNGAIRDDAACEQVCCKTPMDDHETAYETLSRGYCTWKERTWVGEPVDSSKCAGGDRIVKDDGSERPGTSRVRELPIGGGDSIPSSAGGHKTRPRTR